MTAPVHRWVAEPPGAEVEASLRRLAEAEDVVHVAVMPDVHLARDVCIGTVVATRTLLYPAAIGSDVGCGVATLRCDGEAAAVRSRAGELLDGLARAVPIHRHRRLVAPPDPLARDTAVQLGTVGRGNHFLELQTDDEGALWIMVHTGSRSLGPAIQRLYGAGPLDARSDRGRAYLADLERALDWAQLSRQRALAAAACVVRDVLGFDPEPDTYVECAHNLVREEEGLLVHRKGAIPARAGEPGLIPGSMGTSTFHVLGRGCREALCSSSHGAGRRMSRTEARKSISRSALRRQLGDVCCREGPHLTEEAPGAYKDIGAVMRAQRELTRIVREVHPVLCHKG